MTKSNYFNVLLIGGSGLVAGLLNYAYHPIMLKFLSLEEFGAFGSLLAIFNILGVLVVGFDLFLNKVFSENLENKNKVSFTYIHSCKIFGIIAICSYLFYILFSGLVADFLKIDSIYLVILAGFTLVSSFLSIANNALLKSLKSFSFLSFLQVLGPIVKLFIGVGLVWFGFGVFGALLGFIFSSILILLYSFIYIFNKIEHKEHSGTMRDLLRDFFDSKWEMIHFFLLSFLFALLMNLDLLFVRNIFSQELSGIYAGIGVLGKFLIFLLLSVETVYFGQIMEHKKNKVPKHLIKNPLIITAVLSCLALVFNYFFGGFILQTLKPELADYLTIYLWSLLFYAFLSFISFFVKVLIGWKKYYINYILALLVLLLTVLVYNFGTTSLLCFIQVFTLIGCIGFIVIGGCFAFEYKKTISSIEKI